MKAPFKYIKSLFKFAIIILVIYMVPYFTNFSGNFCNSLHRFFNNYPVYTTLHLFKEFIDPSFRKKQHKIVVDNNVIDIVIPVIEKDIPTLLHVVHSTRKMIMHPINNIYLIAPNSSVKIREVAKQLNCVFIAEEQVLKNHKYIKHEGNGWILQQLLKLSVDEFAESEHILIVDADTVFIRPQVFIWRNQYLVNVNLGYPKFYKNYTIKLLDLKKRLPFDFVCHHMLVKKSILHNLKSYIQGRYGQAWDLYLTNNHIENIRNNKRSWLSEYDIYTNYLINFTDYKYRYVPACNLVVPRNKLNAISSMSNIFGCDYKTITLHLQLPSQMELGESHGN